MKGSGYRTSAAEATAERHHAAQRAADLKEQREHGISDADPRRKTEADAATNREIDNAQKRVKIALDKSDAKIENLQEAVGMLGQPNGEKDALALVRVLVATGKGPAGAEPRFSLTGLGRMARSTTAHRVSRVLPNCSNFLAPNRVRSTILIPEVPRDEAY
jgi:hypothetical protein